MENNIIVRYSITRRSILKMVNWLTYMYTLVSSSIRLTAFESCFCKLDWCCCDWDRTTSFSSEWRIKLFLSSNNFWREVFASTRLRRASSNWSLRSLRVMTACFLSFSADSFSVNSLSAICCVWITSDWQHFLSFCNLKHISENK